MNEAFAALSPDKQHQLIERVQFSYDVHQMAIEGLTLLQDDLRRRGSDLNRVQSFVGMGRPVSLTSMLDDIFRGNRLGMFLDRGVCELAEPLAFARLMRSDAAKAAEASSLGVVNIDQIVSHIDDMIEWLAGFTSPAERGMLDPAVTA